MTIATGIPASELARDVRTRMSEYVIGKHEEKLLMQIAFLCNEHILIEGPPGTAKTTLAKVFAQLHGGTFRRVQGTADMLPADITGFMLHKLDGNSAFIAGPIFANFVLLDELNRTSVRTQAALLEAMAEQQVTVEGQTFPLERPFMVIATQLPSGSEGTFALPDIQTDRFLVCAQSTYLQETDECAMLELFDDNVRSPVVPALDRSKVAELQAATRRVFVSDAIKEYITTCVRHIREDADIFGGISHRATVGLYKASRALALLRGREFVIPDDVKWLAGPVMAHRIVVRSESAADGLAPVEVIQRVLAQVPVPK